MTFFVVSFKLV